MIVSDKEGKGVEKILGKHTVVSDDRSGKSVKLLLTSQFLRTDSRILADIIQIYAHKSSYVMNLVSTPIELSPTVMFPARTNTFLRVNGPLEL